MSAMETKTPFFRRRKTCPFTGPNAPKIDWKDTKTLSRYISERGKIMPSRITAVSPRNSASWLVPLNAHDLWLCCHMFVTTRKERIKTYASYSIRTC